MPNYFYVKNGGTASGTSVDSLATNGISDTLLTGNWSGTLSNYFNSIAEAIASNGVNLPVSGDKVLVSNAHALSQTASIIWNIPTDVEIICVEDLNREMSSFGASETATNNSSDFTATGINVVVDGIDISAPDNLLLVNSANNSVTYKNLTITMGSDGADFVKLIGDGSHLTLDNVDFIFNSSFQGFSNLSAGQKIDIINSTLSGSSRLLETSGGGGGMTLNVESSDLSGMLDAAGIFLAAGGGVTDDICSMKFHRCTLPIISGDVVEQPILQPSLTVDMTCCSIVNGSDNPDSYYYERHENYTGLVETETTVVLNSTYDESNKFSLEMSSTNASKSRPLRQLIASIPALDLTSAINYKFNFITNDNFTATDSTFYLEAIYNNDNANALGELVSTKNTNTLSDGIDHLVNTESWVTTGLTSPIKQSETIQIPAVMGMTNGTADIYAVLAEPNQTLFIDMEPVIT